MHIPYPHKTVTLYAVPNVAAGCAKVNGVLRRFKNTVNQLVLALVTIFDTSIPDLADRHGAFDTDAAAKINTNETEARLRKSHIRISRKFRFKITQGVVVCRVLLAAELRAALRQAFPKAETSLRRRRKIGENAKRGAKLLSII